MSSSEAPPCSSARVTLTSCSSRLGRNSWRGGSMSRMTTGSPSIALKMPSKSPCWRTSSLAIAASKVATASCSSAVSVVAGGALRLGAGGDVRDEDGAAHDLQPVALAEHVLGAAQADALRAVAAGLGGLLGLVGVGPDAHPADLVGPAEDLLELGLLLEPRGHGREGAQVQRAGRAVEADPVALLEVGPGDVAVGLLAGVVDDQVGRPGDARLADLAGDDRGVGGRAAAGGDDPLADGHAMEVVGRGLDPDQDDLLAALDPLDGGIGVEHGPTDGGAGRGVEAVDDLLARP